MRVRSGLVAITVVATLIFPAPSAAAGQNEWHQLTSPGVKRALLTNSQIGALAVEAYRFGTVKAVGPKYFDWYLLCGGYTAPARVTAAWYRWYAGSGKYEGSTALTQFASGRAAKRVFEDVIKQHQQCRKFPGWRKGTYVTVTSAKIGANSGCLNVAQKVFADRQRTQPIRGSALSYCRRGPAITVGYASAGPKHILLDVSEYLGFLQADKYQRKAYY